MTLKFFIAATLMMPATQIFAHGGGVDSNGGHTDKSTGSYHCHREGCQIQENSTLQRIAELKPHSYQRDAWPHWSDLDGDCMNTRHEMLLAQADGPVKKSPDGCYISTGTWLDPFSGTVLHRASDLDVDHIVPLKWAHEHGGAYWNRDQRERFANDPENLLVVDDGLNQSKGAKGPDEWLPPNTSYQCEYIAHWNRVLTKYAELQLTVAEQKRFEVLQQNCGFQ